MRSDAGAATVDGKPPPQPVRPGLRARPDRRRRRWSSPTSRPSSASTSRAASSWSTRASRPPQVDGGQPARTSTARSRSSASGSTSSASPSPRSRASAPTRSRSACPTSPNAQRAIDQVGTTAQLYFYDWEPNLIGRRDGRSADARGQQPADDAVREAPKQEPNAPRTQKRENQQLLLAGAYLLPVRRNSLQPNGVDGTAGRRRARASTRRARSDDLLPELPDNRQPYVSRPARTVPQGYVIEVPPGRSSSPTTPTPTADESERRRPGWFALQATDPALSGDRHHRPGAELRPNTNQPNVTFDFTDEGRDAFQEVTRADRPARRQAAGDRAGHAANRPNSSPATSPSSSTTKSTPGRSSTSPRTRTGSTAAPGAQISGSFTTPGGAGPGRRSCRSARCRST